MMLMTLSMPSHLVEACIDKFRGIGGAVIFAVGVACGTARIVSTASAAAAAVVIGRDVAVSDLIGRGIAAICLAHLLLLGLGGVRRRARR